MHKRAQAGELQPEMPVFKHVQLRVKGATTFDGLSAKQDGMNRHEVVIAQAQRVEGVIEAVHEDLMPVFKTHHVHPAVGGNRRGRFAQRNEQTADMLRQQPVIIIQKGDEFAVCVLQTQVGSLGATMGSCVFQVAQRANRACGFFVEQ